VGDAFLADRLVERRAVFVPEDLHDPRWIQEINLMELSCIVFHDGKWGVGLG